MSGGAAGYDGLIDPSQFPFRSAEMDVDGLSCAATTLRRMGSGVSASADGLIDSWSGLRPVYQGPQQEQVWGLMRPVAVSAERLEGDLSTAADRLDDLAASWAVLRAQLVDLERRAARFRDEVAGGVWAPITEGADFTVTLDSAWGTIPWSQDTDTVARNEDLLLEHAKLVERITTASAECHNALMDLVRWATDEHDVVGVQAEQLMDRRVEYPWGTPVAEDRHWGESIGHGGYMFGYNLAAGAAGLLLGYDMRMEEYSEGYRGEVAGALGDAWLSSSVTGLWGALAAASPGLAGVIDRQLSGDQRQWLQERRVVTASVGGDLVGVDVHAHLNGEDGLWRWREDGIATATESALNIGSMFTPSGGAAAGALRTGSLGARLLRIVTGAGDFLVPGASALTYGSIRVTSGLASAIRRVDDIPVVEPHAGGVAGNAVDAADTNTVVLDQPLSDELFGEGRRTNADGAPSAEGVDVVHHGTSPADAPPVQIDRTEYSTSISAQRQARHLQGSPKYDDGGYFRDPSEAQAVLDAFHDGSAEVLGLKSNGDVVVRVDGVTGFNISGAYRAQATDVFFIKGTTSPSAVPYNPNWVPRPPRT
ncbi:hypothetical protein [Pseudactinotalea terrae]|uniref:hypothetical protein n=1 Tax=Pseudactinotalea terrae TaxID=1743262 RepID=UPI0012E202B3|nr:hypothetical protein [Pseudactinotalea terrae]